MGRNRCAYKILAAIAIALGVTGAASAQTQARVVKDQAIIWSAGVPTPLTTVPRGTVLEVLGRQDDFFVVRLPERGGRSGAETGLIAVSQVEVIAGGAESVRPAPRAAPVPTVSTPSAGERPISVFGFGQAAYSGWLAHQTFSAVLGSRGSPIFGAGGQVRVQGRFLIEGAVQRFEKSGQRVFVHNGEVFPLGIRDTVRIIPVFFTASYRQPHENVAFYGGGGVGRYSYKETSDFADPSENVDARFTSYHVVAGVEVGAPRSMLRTAVELLFTSVPNALGTDGASAAFGERNLGSVQIGIKILAGR